MKVNDQWNQVWKQSWHEVHKSKCPELIKLRDVQRSEGLQSKRPWMDHQSTEGAESWHNCNRLGHWPHGLSLLPGTMRGWEKDDPGSQPSISKKTLVIIIMLYIYIYQLYGHHQPKESQEIVQKPWSTNETVITCNHCVQFPMPFFFLGTVRHHPVTRSSSTPVSSLTNLTFQKRLQWQ